MVKSKSLELVPDADRLTGRLRGRGFGNIGEYTKMIKSKECNPHIVSRRKIKGLGNKKYLVCEKCLQPFVPFMNDKVMGIKSKKDLI